MKNNIGHNWATVNSGMSALPGPVQFTHEKIMPEVSKTTAPLFALVDPSPTCDSLMTLTSWLATAVISKTSPTDR
ncbi:hypothetical protein DPMN_021237 [Dreissena polymorpha]|uniref:Uncharacterized protein n=1 Tax=Dreissena polymorpha TaxID=45954 RepID=A0A9D4NLU1_DREPO|nr:hypothetical protein DPMN_021237 [Dreissena polymorpha]